MQGLKYQPDKCVHDHQVTCTVQILHVCIAITRSYAKASMM